MLLVAKKQTKVWLLTSGSYSDFTIRGVFSTKAAAEETMVLAKNLEGYDDNLCVRDYLLETEPRQAFPVVVLEAAWDDAGKRTERRDDRVSWDIYWELKCEKRDGRWGGRLAAYTLNVRGTDIDRCQKVFTERKAAIQALHDTTGKWPK